MSAIGLSKQGAREHKRKDILNHSSSSRKGLETMRRRKGRTMTSACARTFAPNNDDGDFY